ncbi:fas-associated death domain protein isoform X2 [Cotesia typhae]|uniref:fas-associated death domain protein isoform X2 n=1 Tax=Cotesia typhae TaxID=2053667 RepID=UPI003D683180
MTVDMGYLSIWDEYQSRYTHLKQKFLEIASLHVNNLLKILENRSVLSYNKINVLKEIAETYIKDVVLNQIIKDYEAGLQLHQTLPLFNIYKYRSGEYFSIDPNNDNLCNNNANNQLEILSDHEGTNFLHIEPTINYLQSTPENILNLQSNNEIKLSRFETININQNTCVSQDSSKSLLKYIVVCINVSLLVIVLIIILYFIIPYIKSPALAASTSSLAGPETTQSTGYHQTHTVTLSYEDHSQQLTELKTFQLSDLQAKIFYLVSDNIGRYWRDLARILGVKEAHIDSIELKDIPIKDKSFQTLEIFISRCLGCDWETKLIRSLDTVRRRDLAEMVQDILAKNN